MKKLILVVEDSDAIRFSLTALLEAAGYDVIEAANGREALDYLERSGPPCLILLDLSMPVMDGWGFRERQRRDPALAAVPVLIQSAEPDLAATAAALDAAGHLCKPFTADALLQAVRAHVGRPRVPRLSRRFRPGARPAPAGPAPASGR